jgi:ketosteroid isomerase-like protein
MSTVDEVREASKQFYAALNSMLSGKAGSMSDIWSHNPSVITMHPIGGREVGWDAVNGSFEGVSQLASGGQVELKDQLIGSTDDMAYETGIEYGQAELAGNQVTINHRVTNIYQREGGAWKIVLHHGDIAPAMLEVLSKLQPPPQ